MSPKDDGEGMDDDEAENNDQNNDQVPGDPVGGP